ncbi:CDP-alcohol phosphatidyltransferase family protein [Gordonia oryzae]|uniref:CDP-alcohol phosphatidyltransferase family protein n=1 Tax=Gordonia oryzae TaxID=2487349 RepID=A0A3N4G4M7_9ACTN|nr:CDP-alcohol phosphatidyltransferase family protein [Gordonia oryzae]RPA57842.1 CDP-alcohol phosphatidyltransferase family protein [Gordonia oryzae]
MTGSGAEDDGAVTSAAPGVDRVLTVPNMLSVLRLVLIPVFIWLVIVEKADGWAFVVLFVSGVTDWLDGKLARLLGQSSRLGELLDPAADRLYIVVIPICFGLRDVVPWWLIGVIIARDVLLFASAPLLRSRGLVALPVLYVGKAATFALMSAFPWLLAGQLDSVVGAVCHPIGWAFLIWGVGMYLWSFVLYWAQTIMVMRTMPRLDRVSSAAAG